MSQPEARLYNSRLIDNFIKLLRANYPQINTDAMIKRAGMEIYEIADQGVWFTQEQINRFYQEVAKTTDNPKIAREAGRYAASAEGLGTMRQYILTMLGPAKAFALGSKLSEILTKSANYDTVVLGQNSVEVTVTLRDGVREEPFQCENRIGVFEAIVSIFNFKPPVIEHDECLFKGNEACRYIIRWQPDATARVKQFRDVYAMLAVITNLWFALASPEQLSYVLPVSVVGLLSMNWWLDATRKNVGETTINQLQKTSEQLNEQINLNHRNTQLTREIGEVLASQNHIHAVIETVSRILEQTLDYDRGLILLANEEKQRLEIRGAFGYSTEHIELLENTSFRLDNPGSQGPFVVSYRGKKPLLVNDVNEISGQVTPKSRQFIETLGIKSFMVVPIILEDQSLGILALDNCERKKELVNSDLNLLLGIAPSIGISIHNAALNEARENQFAATIKVLAHSIDARDFLTSGHSEVVAEYAVAIAMELDMPHEYCQMIRIAALLHDYGKIGVPDTVLKKDGPLTDDERAMIETHSQKSCDILRQVPFEGLYQEIPQIALHHHERWDGTGYPQKLKGDEIPYGARIVAVADFFEAITSKRHYRDPMPIHVAINLLKQESGTHFDQKIVDAFLKYLNRPKKPSDSDDENKGSVNLPHFREPRFAISTKVQVKVGDLTIGGKSIDISSGGVFLQLDRHMAEKIERGASLEMELTLPNTSIVKASGRVRWLNFENNMPSRRHPIGIGVAFTNLDKLARQGLERTLHKITRGSDNVLQPQLSV